MADDTGGRYTTEQFETAAPQERRGPLRPERLQSARTRISGSGLARLFQIGDASILALASLAAGSFMTLPQPVWLGAPLLGVLLLVWTGAYTMNPREPAWRR